MLPLPVYVLEWGFSPPLRPLFLGSLVAPIVATDPDLLSGVFTGLLWGQGALQAYLLWRASGWLSRRIPAGGLRIPVVAGIVAVLFVAACFPIFRFPLSSSGQLNLFGIFQ